MLHSCSNALLRAFLKLVIAYDLSGLVAGSEKVTTGDGSKEMFITATFYLPGAHSVHRGFKRRFRELVMGVSELQWEVILDSIRHECCIEA